MVFKLILPFYDDFYHLQLLPAFAKAGHLL